MKALDHDEISAVSGAGDEGMLYYVGYGIGRGIRGLNQFGSWLGSSLYDATHNIP